MNMNKMLLNKNKTFKRLIFNFILISAFFFLLVFVLFLNKSYSAERVAVMPYKIVSTHYQRYLYITKSIPILLGSDISSKNIYVIRHSDIKNFIKANRITSFSNANLSKITKKFNLQYIIYGRILKIGNVFDITANLFDTSENIVIFRKSITALGTNFIINDINGISKSIKNKILSYKKINNKAISISPQIAEKRINKTSAFIKRYSANIKGIIKTAPKAYVIQAFAAGDILNKGIQAVVATRHRIILYNLRLNGSLNKVAYYPLSGRSNVIYLNFFKISNNRNAIVVTKTKLGMVISYLLVYSGKGKLLTKLTSDYPMFLRVMQLNNGKKVLIGQNPVQVISSGRFFDVSVIGQNNYPIGQFGGSTYIYNFNSSNNSLSKFKKLPFYSGITIYGSTYGNIKNNGKNYLLALSNSGNLMLINKKGHTIYTGSGVYGGSPLQVRVPSFGGSRSATYTGGLIYNVPPTLVKYYNNGKFHVIVLKNFGQMGFVSHLNYYTKSAVYDLIWNKIGFSPIWEIKPVSGYSAGFSIIKNNNKVYIADAVVANPGSIFTKAQSYIVLYKISN
jgi:TolB-like protein